MHSPPNALLYFKLSHILLFLFSSLSEQSSLKAIRWAQSRISEPEQDEEGVWAGDDLMQGDCLLRGGGGIPSSGMDQHGGVNLSRVTRILEPR